MIRAISMRDLQKLSAGTIRSLPHAVPIKNGAETVGVLLPVSRGSQEYLSKVLAEIDAAVARETPEETHAIDALLAERGID